MVFVSSRLRNVTFGISSNSTVVVSNPRIDFSHFNWTSALIGLNIDHVFFPYKNIEVNTPNSKQNNLKKGNQKKNKIKKIKKC